MANSTTSGLDNTTVLDGDDLLLVSKKSGGTYLSRNVKYSVIQDSINKVVTDLSPIINSKANQTDLIATNNLVDTKASQVSLDATNETVNQKANTVDVYSKTDLSMTKRIQDANEVQLGAGANGWTALVVQDASGKNQQQINDFGGAKWYAKSGGYDIGSTVKLENGDIVKSTVANSIINPNVDMTGWVYVNDAEIAKHAVYVPNGGGSIGAIGGTFRGYSGGVQFISDTAHAPIGTTGISKADTYTVRIDHDFGAAKVGAMNLTADESFAAMGVMSGASVAQGHSLAKVIAPLYFTCRGDGTITKVSPLFEGSVVLNAASNPANGILRFTHPLKSVAAHQAIACNRGFVDNISKPMEINVFNSDSGTYTQIQAYTEQVDSVWIKYNETTANFEAAQGINKALYSFAFNASTGLLSITHKTVKTGAYLPQPDIIPFQTANRYSINFIGTDTTHILCYDPAGNIVKTLSTANFSFFFKIKPAVREMVLTAIPATNEFEVFVGNCYVPVDNLQKVPSGNIWFYGAMNK